MLNLAQIKQIYYSPYQLQAKKNLNAKSQKKTRYGVLLRVEFENLGWGFADCHPWAELGDDSLEQQLSLLAKNICTPLTEKSIYFARIDANYRSSNKSLFSNKTHVQNHFITSYENLSKSEILKIKSLEFKFLKLKFGINLKAEIEFLKKNYSIFKESKIKLRLDFNSSINMNDCMQFISEIQNELDILDFLEDPCEFNPEDWKHIQNTYAVSLALDRKTKKAYEVINNNNSENMNIFRVLIIKPAIEDMQDYYSFPPEQRIIFTSYMDHPLGQLCAMAEAENFYEKFPEKREHGGFLTHQLYEANLYSEELKIEDTVLKTKLEPGFGFEKLLDKENWIPIKGFIPI